MLSMLRGSPQALLCTTARASRLQTHRMAINKRTLNKSKTVHPIKRGTNSAKVSMAIRWHFIGVLALALCLCGCGSYNVTLERSLSSDGQFWAELAVNRGSVVAGGDWYAGCPTHSRSLRMCGCRVLHFTRGLG